MEVIRRRVDETGTKEPTIERQGEDRILLQLPGVQDPSRMKDILGTTAKLTFRFVDQSMSVQQAEATHVPPGDEILPASENNRGGPSAYLIRKRVMVSGENLKNAQPGFSPQTNQPVVNIRFRLHRRQALRRGHPQQCRQAVRHRARQQGDQRAAHQ